MTEEKDYITQLAAIAENTTMAAVFANDFSLMPLGDQFARFVFMEKSLPELPRQSRAAVMVPDDLAFSIADAIIRYREIKTKQKLESMEAEGKA